MITINEKFINELENKITTAVSKAIEAGIMNASKIKPKEDNGYLTRKSAADYLKICTVTLDLATKEELIRCKRIMGSTRYLKSDLDDAMKTRIFTGSWRNHKNGK